MSLEEPSISELIRTLSAKMDGVAAQLGALQAQMGQYVTQEQRQADKDLADLQRQELAKDVADLIEGRRTMLRSVWSAGALPVIVGLVLWFLSTGGGK